MIVTSRVRVLAFAVIAPAVAGAALRWWVRQDEMSRLARAAETLPVRHVPGRISRDVEYRPLGHATRASSLRIRSVVADLFRNDGNLHAKGVGLVLVGRYDDAIVTFREALAVQPDDVEVLNDLSVAHYARATAKGFLPDFASALDAAERAWALKRTPYAAWNRALALSAYHVEKPAVRAWNAVLATEDDPRWLREAEAQLAKLRETRPLVRDPYSEFEQQKILNWARAHQRRAAEDERRHRDAAAQLAEILHAQGDHFARDTLTSIAEACRARSGCEAIAALHVLFGEAQALTAEERYSEAAGMFDDLSFRFGAVDSPYAHYARFRRAVCLIHANELTAAQQLGMELLPVLAAKRYLTLQAHTHWLLGLTALNAGRPNESIEHYGKARSLFAHRRDAENAAQIDLLLADALEYGGDGDAAMEHRIHALRGMREANDGSRLPLALFESGTRMADRGLSFAADTFLAECMREADARRQYAVGAMAAMWRSRIAAQRGRFAAAADLAHSAHDRWRRIADPGRRALGA